jgi:FMN phosphatase YigB (HAD superfamily)
VKKLRVGIDFDRVLFDTDSFDEFYKDEVEGLYHVEEPAPVKNGCYDPEKHAELCDIPIEKIWKVFENDLSRFLYSDVDLLEDLSDYDLILVSRGHEKFQRQKIQASKIADRFEEVIIVQKKPKDTANIDILFDDRKEELERAEVPGFQISRPEEGVKKIKEKVADLES